MTKASVEQVPIWPSIEDPIFQEKARLSSLWTQFAQRFTSYSNKLIFEGSRGEEGRPAEGRDRVNQFNQVVLDSTRATGGNNLNRFVMITTYATSAKSVALDDSLSPSTTTTHTRLRVARAISITLPWIARSGSFCWYAGMAKP